MGQFAAVATVSSKGQLTLPKAIRSALDLSAGTKLGFTMVGDEMHVVKVEEDGDHHDPALCSFLDLLASDIARGEMKASLPEDVLALARGRDLSAVDPEEAIEGDVAL